MAHHIRLCWVTLLEFEATFVYPTGILSKDCWDFFAILSDEAFELLSFIHQFSRLTQLISISQSVLIVDHSLYVMTPTPQHLCRQHKGPQVVHPSQTSANSENNLNSTVSSISW